MIFYLITTILFAATSLYSYFNGRTTLDKSKILLEDYIYLNELDNKIETLEMEVEKYLSTLSSESLINFYEIQNELKESNKMINKQASYDLDVLLMKDIGNMIDELLNESELAIINKRGKVSSEYNRHFKRTVEIGGYIRSHINSLLNYELEEGSDKYEQTSSKMFVALIINLALIILTVIISLIIAIAFTYSLTRPIIELSHSAERVSQGDFNIEPVKIRSDDEVNVLSVAFDKMVFNIKNYIEEIKRKAEMENQLKEKEMENLTMESLLKETELKMLQSQINPHFLFNTLNAASQLSVMEGADRTAVFIEKAAELFRYSLRKLNEPISLKEEVENVEAYMYILGTRFGDKISFSLDIEESVLDLRVPCIIIQPIVENAYIHGLEDLERDGEIRLTVKQKFGWLYIEVFDNGQGMTEEQVDAIIEDVSNENKVEHHVTGIGIRNVIDRLRIYYNIPTVKEMFSIESEIGVGTTVTLRIPYEERGNKND